MPETEMKQETEVKEESGGAKNEKIDSIVSAVENLTVRELSKLVKALEDKFGVSAQMAVAPMAGAGGQSGAGAPAAEEKTTFNVILASVGDKKIQVIKEVRAITNLGLKEAKDLVENAPKPIKEGVTKEEAEQIKKKMTEQGASVEIK